MSKLKWVNMACLLVGLIAIVVSLTGGSLWNNIILIIVGLSCLYIGGSGLIRMR